MFALCKRRSLRRFFLAHVSLDSRTRTPQRTAPEVASRSLWSSTLEGVRMAIGIPGGAPAGPDLHRLDPRGWTDERRRAPAGRGPLRGQLPAATGCEWHRGTGFLANLSLPFPSPRRAAWCDAHASLAQAPGQRLRPPRTPGARRAYPFDGRIGNGDGGAVRLLPDVSGIDEHVVDLRGPGERGEPESHLRGASRE